MAAVLGLSAPQVETLLATSGLPVDLANLNAPQQQVVAGAEADVLATERLVTAAGGRWIRLPVSGAFHSRQMQPLAARFAKLVDATPLSPPSATVYANATARPYGDDPAALLVSQLHQPVRWAELVESVREHGPCTLVELGPGATLTRLEGSPRP